MKGILYMVFDSSKDNKKYYIGSTTQSDLNKRLNQHIQAFKSYLNGKYNFYSIFNIFLDCNMVFDSIEIKQIEKVEVLDEFELKCLEQECITNFKILQYNVININRPINKNLYKQNKSYRDLYKQNKRCKMVLQCPCCQKNIKVSISAISGHYIDNDNLDYS